MTLIAIFIVLFKDKEMHLKMPPGKWQPFCLDIDVLIDNRLLRNIWIYELADLKIHIEGIWMVLFYNQNLVIIILRYPGA